ncbi:hypothetical protein [Paraherbaspirillum soli]|uniref:Uncharacterized protein n=1 Tax=Paraherbaspirillum soli TaxID=631222 RepID=A0ABW0M3L6_9BURK
MPLPFRPAHNYGYKTVRNWVWIDGKAIRMPGPFIYRGPDCCFILLGVAAH